MTGVEGGSFSAHDDATIIVAGTVNRHHAAPLSPDSLDHYSVGGALEELAGLTPREQARRLAVTSAGQVAEILVRLMDAGEAFPVVASMSPALVQQLRDRLPEPRAAVLAEAAEAGASFADFGAVHRRRRSPRAGRTPVARSCTPARAVPG